MRNRDIGEGEQAVVLKYENQPKRPVLGKNCVDTRMWQAVQRAWHTTCVLHF